MRCNKGLAPELDCQGRTIERITSKEAQELSLTAQEGSYNSETKIANFDGKLYEITD